jgi:anti-sigma factor RsiW
MLKCQSPLQEDLKAYLDSELAPVRHAAVTKHLLSCPACQSELAALRQLSTQLTEALPAPAPLSDALRARILATLPETPQPRPTLLSFWRRPGPLAFGGVLAAGCAFWLWARVPESSKVSAPAPQVANKAMSEAPAASVAESKAFADNVPQPAVAAAPAEAQKEAQVIASPALSAATPTPAPTPLPLPSQQSPVNSQRSIAPAKPRTNVLTIPEPGTHKAEADTGSPPSASVADSMDAKKATLELKSQDSSQQLRALTARRVAVPASYTLTIAAGKRTETLETIHKLAEELSVTVGEEQPELNFQLAPERREVLLERLKALGALVETPPSATTTTYANPTISSGPAPAAKVTPPSQSPLQLILVIKESEPKKESERKELP